MVLLGKIFLGKDNTVKYVFKTDDNLVIEYSYINKDDGKDIICVPTQTACKMKCKFCHITDIADKLINRNLTATEIKDGVDFVYNDLKLYNEPKVLLISYMGCGEPVINYKNTLESMKIMREEYQDKKVPLIRYGLATSLPKFCYGNFYKMISFIEEERLPVKIHLSLHYTQDELRKEWMGNSLEIKASISALEHYKEVTGNSVEIHYAMIEGLNDNEEDISRIVKLLRHRDIPIKFLFYNEKDTIEFNATEKKKIDNICTYLEENEIKTEYYIPPGLDIGASCGQFLLDYYEKYNTI